MDRLKDIIIRGGENIDCSEVEAGLYPPPAVRECSVFGLPDDARMHVYLNSAAFLDPSYIHSGDIAINFAVNWTPGSVDQPDNFLGKLQGWLLKLPEDQLKGVRLRFALSSTSSKSVQPRRSARLQSESQ